MLKNFEPNKIFSITSKASKYVLFVFIRTLIDLFFNVKDKVYATYLCLHWLAQRCGIGNMNFEFAVQDVITVLWKNHTNLILQYSTKYSCDSEHRKSKPLAKEKQTQETSAMSFAMPKHIRHRVDSTRKISRDCLVPLSVNFTKLTTQKISSWSQTLTHEQRQTAHTCHARDALLPQKNTRFLPHFHRYEVS